MRLLQVNALSLGCLAIAGVLVCIGRDGWGWFLALSLFTWTVHDKGED